MFFKRKMWQQSQGLNLTYELAADYELWIRFARFNRLVSVNLPLASFRINNQGRSRVFKDKYRNEVNNIFKSINSKWVIFFSNRLFNIFLRLFTWKKQDIIYYSNDKKSGSTNQSLGLF